MRKAGAGNLLMTMKDLEGQTIEYTQYMPGSRHFEDRGKHLGDGRVAKTLLGATAPARDVSAIRNFYVEKLGFRDGSDGALRMPGESGQRVEITAGRPSGMTFGVADVAEGATALAALGLEVKRSGEALRVRGPDGVEISFAKGK
ncbi:MAG: VOC family protein [Ignavibacteriota bacterium]